MGLLDALFANNSGGGLLGGLPASWQYQNPQDAIDQKKFLEGLSQDPSMGNNLVTPQSPFGAVPQLSASPSIFQTGAPALASGLNPAMFQQQPQAQSPAMQPPQSVAPSPQVVPPQDVPTNTLNIGGYQMPQFGSPQTAQAQPRATDVSAQSRQPEQQQALPPAFGGGGYFDRLHNGGSLIGSLFQSSTPAQQNLRAQYEATQQALISAGKSPKEASSLAMLAVMNPEAAKTLLPEALTNKETYQVVSDNPIEGKKYGFVNPINQTINGKALGEGGDGGQSGGMLAPGVKLDSSKTGEDYINQFSPEVKAAAKAWLNGDVMPTGNPRQQGITTVAKTVAQKYANDLGIPASDAIYGAKRKMQTDLAASGNSSMGGILSNGKSSFKHLAEYTDSAADLGNASYNVPLGGIAAHTQNFIGNTLGGSNTQGKIKAISDNLGHYGQESTKFYAASGGGVEERTNALKQMNPATNSGEEVAAYAEKEKNLMLDRFREKEAQVRDVMGDKYLQDHPVFSDELKRDIARIDANVARLRGESRPTGNTTKSGVSWSIVK